MVLKPHCENRMPLPPVFERLTLTCRDPRLFYNRFSCHPLMTGNSSQFSGWNVIVSVAAARSKLSEISKLHAGLCNRIIVDVVVEHVILSHYFSTAFPCRLQTTTPLLADLWHWLLLYCGCQSWTPSVWINSSLRRRMRLWQRKKFENHWSS